MEQGLLHQVLNRKDGVEIHPLRVIFESAQQSWQMEVASGIGSMDCTSSRDLKLFGFDAFTLKQPVETGTTLGVVGPFGTNLYLWRVVGQIAYGKQSPKAVAKSAVRDEGDLCHRSTRVSFHQAQRFYRYRGVGQVEIFN